jgi:hypothetical protein
MPKLERKVREILVGKADTEILSGEEKWCTFMKYRHEDWAEKLIEELTRKEEGIMRAERAVAKIDRDYWKAIDKMNELKNRMDRAQLEYDARQEGLTEGRAEGRVEGRAEGKREERENIITLLKSGKSAAEIIQLMENE